MQYETHIVSSSQPLLLLSPCTYAYSVKYTHKQNYECERERERERERKGVISHAFTVMSLNIESTASTF